MQINPNMESTSALPSRSRRPNNSVSTNNSIRESSSSNTEFDPLQIMNGQYQMYVNNTRRKRTEKENYKQAIAETADIDEDPEDPAPLEPEHRPIQDEEERVNQQRIAAQMADIMKKLSAVNAFTNPLLDNLPKVIKTEPLQSVGTMLDASAKIYAFRVDHTHHECFIVRKDIGDEKELKKKKPDSIDDDDQDIALRDGQDKHRSVDNDEEAIDEDQPGPSKKSKKAKKLLPAVDEEKLREHQKQMGVTIERFRQVLELEDEVAVNSVVERFQFFSDSVIDRLGSRRELVTYLERASEDLNMDADVHDLDEPYYHKATVGFEEGSAQSLLLKRVQMSRDGRFLLLHNKWRNMDFDSISQLTNREPSQEINLNLDEEVDKFCAILQDRVGNTADITIADLVPDVEDIEDFDELLEESVPTTPSAFKKRAVNDEQRTLRFDEDDDFIGAGANLDETLTIQGDGQDAMLDLEAENQPAKTHQEEHIELGPAQPTEELAEGEPPDNGALIEEIAPAESIENVPLDPGQQPIPDDSHWQNAPNQQEKVKKPEKRKRNDSDATDSVLGDVSWAHRDEVEEELFQRLTHLQITTKPSSVTEKRDKIITPIGDTYDLRDNECAVYKYTGTLRLKMFYSNRDGYYRYRPQGSPPIVWVPSSADWGMIRAHGLDVSFDEFVQEYEAMNLNREPRIDEPAIEKTIEESNGTLIQAQPNHDEDSLVDFNNDSNHELVDEAQIDFNATQLLAVPLDNMGGRSAELVLNGFGDDLDKTGLSTASHQLKSQAISNPVEPEYSDVEEVEINGMEIKIRPCRVKAIVVKKAMKKILSKSNTESRAIVRDGEEIVQDFVIQGTHTIGSLLGELPDYLRGRTKRDLNIVNAFSILLQMCNENNLYLHQNLGEDGMVTKEAMSQFEIRNSATRISTSSPRNVQTSAFVVSPAGRKRSYPVEIEELKPSTSTNNLFKYDL